MRNTEWHYTNILFNKKLFKSQNVNIPLFLYLMIKIKYKQSYRNFYKNAILLILKQYITYEFKVINN